VGIAETPPCSIIDNHARFGALPALAQRADRQ
jgi:hypothetical protein